VFRSGKMGSRNGESRKARDTGMTDDTRRVPLPQVRDLLVVGQALPFRVLDAHGRLLLNEGHVLLDEDQFDALVERGAWAEPHLVKAAREARSAAGASSKVGSAPSLFDRWERSIWQLDTLLRQLARGAATAADVVTFFDTLQALVDRDPDIALFLSVRQNERRFALYPVSHAIQCAVLVLLASRQLGWPAARSTSLGCAALTMNLSLMDLQAAMAEQDTPPSTKQLGQIRLHPEESAARLRSLGVDDPDWLAAVLEHHEHPGGGGYPHDLAAPGDGAQLLRAADVYMAKITARAKRPALAAQTAMRQLFEQRPGDPLALAMIKTLGVHPPGALVRLASGEVAVVIRRPTAGTRPLVATLSDRKGQPSKATHKRDTAEPEFAIAGPLEDTKPFARIVPERVYGLVSG